jgi:hypothetical protein
MQFDERRYRPLTTVDLFDEAFDLYKRNFVLFLSIVAIVVVPSTILTDIYSLKMINAVVGRITGGDLATADATTFISALSDFTHQLVNQTANFYTILLVPWTLTFLAMTAAVSSRYLDKPTSVRLAYVSSFRRIIPGVLGAIVFSLAVNAGTVIACLSFVLPDIGPLLIFVGCVIELFTGIIFLAKYPLFMGAIVNERLGPLQSLKRSSVLTKADTGRIIWTLICLTVLIVTVFGAIETVLELVTGQLVSSGAFVIPILQNNKIVADQIAHGLVGMLLTPFLMIVLTLIYFDQRIRKEGYDVDVLASNLGYPEIAAGTYASYAPALSIPAVKTMVRKK